MAKIKHIADYFKDLEKGLVEWDYRGLPTFGHLTELHKIVKALMDATFKTQKSATKVLLASLEYKAR